MKVVEKIASVISAVSYPLWMPSYGMVLFCMAMQQVLPLPVRYWIVVVGFTLLLTGILPISLILYQVKKGYIDDIYITNREQRTWAYVQTVVCFAFWWYMLSYQMHAPAWLCGTALGGTIAIALVAVINRWWKISAHLTGMGGLVGGILAYSITTSHMPMATIITALVLTLLVMYARLWLNAHTSGQVIAGLALGLSCTILTSICYV